jgi:hypothetical protein
VISHALPVPEQVPLTTLLSWAWIAHTIEIDNAFEAVGSERVGRRFRISLPMWTNALRLIGEDGITVGELRSQARASCNIGGLERWGWISVGDTGGGRRDGFGTHRGVKGGTAVRPTRAGAYARRLWPGVVGGVDDRWRARFGDGAIDQLRAVLLAARAPMPWSPPEVSPSDGFRTHVVDGGDAPDPEPPLVALLGQVLTAFTIDHERESAVALPLGANVVRVIGPDPARIRDLPALTGLSKEGIAMAAAHLQRQGLAAPAPDRTLSLTPAGTEALERYRDRSGRQHDHDLREALEAVVEQGGALSAGLVPPNGCWRGEKPYLAQTRRLVADPLGALPWHPMVLHRGGWPDAS